jgi:formylglycine-generating enzyme
VFVLSALAAVSCGNGKSPSGPGDISPVTIQGMPFVSIPGGTFQMGDVEGGGASDQKPVHAATLTGFDMGVNEITNAQYAKYLNDALKTGDIAATISSATGAKGTYSGREYIYLSGTVSGYPDARCWITYHDNTFGVEPGHESWPVIWVTWYGAKAFALSYGLDLPTEAEWEYACRGGKQYEYGTDDGTLGLSKANYRDNGPGGPVAAGSYPANPFGLYDMSGNVWEWCHDRYGSYASSGQTDPAGAQSGSLLVMRGGSCFSLGSLCRAAYRSGITPDEAHGLTGFRVVHRAGHRSY